MTELTTPSPSPPPPPHNKPAPQHHHHFSTTTLLLLLFSDIHLLLSTLISHPLYLSYFLFFSPSLLKLLSFLSPLFLTTSLLLLSILFTLSRPLSPTHQSLHDFDYSATEALQVYNIVFDVGDQLLAAPRHHQLDGAAAAAEEPPREGSIMTLATLLHQKQEELGDMLLPGNHEEEKEEAGKEVKAAAPPPRVKSSKVEVGQREEGLLAGPNNEKSGLKATTATSGGFEEANLGSYGSMRKEKEWRRTLACKLFEERHNADSSEGMDSLWETYETESGNNGNSEKKSKSKLGKKKGASNKIGHHHYDDNDGKEEEEEEEEMGGGDGRLCCLQALKFSAGKMNLGGMGKPNLVKISKAFKGFGWLHNVTHRHPKAKRVPLN
ncbi:unnamed protein product [Linum tenue]|uniref:Uncharacterized protein n=1 Tax=Linum tenue TaxID=586396 RepID=A0AAV0KXW5_9ROSI|nr:unnamed protein product [Linum tenue]